MATIDKTYIDNFEEYISLKKVLDLYITYA